MKRRSGRLERVGMLLTSYQVKDPDIKVRLDRQVDKETLVQIHDGILLNHIKEHIQVSSDEVDEPRAYYTE